MSIIMMYPADLWSSSTHDEGFRYRRFGSDFCRPRRSLEMYPGRRWLHPRPCHPSRPCNGPTCTPALTNNSFSDYLNFQHILDMFQLHSIFDANQSLEEDYSSASGDHISREDEDHDQGTTWKLIVPVPNFDPKSIRVKVAAGRLVIHAASQQDGEMCRCSRVVALPAHVDESRVSARLRAGELVITAPCNTDNTEKGGRKVEERCSDADESNRGTEHNESIDSLPPVMNGESEKDETQKDKHIGSAATLSVSCVNNEETMIKECADVSANEAAPDEETCEKPTVSKESSGQFENLHDAMCPPTVGRCEQLPAMPHSVDTNDIDKSSRDNIRLTKINPNKLSISISNDDQLTTLSPGDTDKVAFDMSIYKPEDINVSINGNNVTIHADVTRQDGDVTCRFTTTNSFHLHDDADVDKVTCSMSDSGTLSIFAPKRQSQD